MTTWIGCGVSIDCGESLGSYQGTIVEADEACITLNKAFCNGLPCQKSRITIKAKDIKNIEIIQDNPESSSEKPHSTVEVVKSAKKSHKFPMMDSINSHESKSITTQPSSSNKIPNATHINGQFSQKSPGFSYANSYPNSAPNLNNSKSKPIDIVGRQTKPNGGMPTLIGSTPNKRDKERRRNEQCFGTPSDDPVLTEEFDFEKNLALFDKQALWEQLNQSHKPDVVRQTDKAPRKNSQTKYRHDENILETRPVTHRAIIVPNEGKGPVEYVTDDGLVIPTLTNEFRMKLLTACGQAGLEGAELFARAGTEVALQLLGGTRRLHPCNLHQMPTVVFFIGPHRQGVVGLTCARQLASHGVTTIVVIPTPDIYHTALKSHLSMYQLTGNKVISNPYDLPTADLIIMALCENSNDLYKYIAITEWIEQSRAPVLALDPPPQGTPKIIARYSLLPILPLAHSPRNGKLYLCNLAIPKQVFSELGIEYSSPFGAKFVIALHSNA